MKHHLSSICQIVAETEALMLTSGHPFIMTLYSCFKSKDHILFVTECMSGGDPKEQLDEVEVFSQKRATFYVAEITLAVQCLHQRGILHWDGHCKSAHFGLSKLGLFSHCKARYNLAFSGLRQRNMKLKQWIIVLIRYFCLVSVAYPCFFVLKA